MQCRCRTIRRRAYISKSVNEEDGLFIYGSYNKPPRGIFLLKVDSSGSISESEPANKQFFKPVKKISKYCLSPLQVEDQVIYYKNDSRYIMVLENGFTITTHAAAGGKLTPDPDTGKCTYKKGASVSFKAEAHAGYMMADFVKDGESVRKSGYGPADNEEGCDFYNLLDNHMVKAVFMLKIAKKPSEIIGLSMFGYTVR